MNLYARRNPIPPYVAAHLQSIVTEHRNLNPKRQRPKPRYNTKQRRRKDVELRGIERRRDTGDEHRFMQLHRRVERDPRALVPRVGLRIVGEHDEDRTPGNHRDGALMERVRDGKAVAVHLPDEKSICLE